MTTVFLVVRWFHISTAYQSSGEIV